MDKKLNIKEYLDRDEQKDLLKFLTAGSVDDGKSTLIGRLLADSKKIYDDQLSALERDSKRIGKAGAHIDYALLCDGLKAEREQGITIDVAYRYFSTNSRKFIIADTPGHEQYTRNMITGGSNADLAVILVDATKGVVTQTRRHSYIVSLLGIKHVVLTVNKMDMVEYSEEVFNSIAADYMRFAAPLGIPDIKCVPISALEGDNVVDSSARMPWYGGQTLLSILETVKVGRSHSRQALRMPIQYVSRPDSGFRGFCGRVASGILRQGDEVAVLPSGRTTRIKRIVTADGDLPCAFPPMCITVTTADEIDISRGDMIVHKGAMPCVGRHIKAMLVWMDESPMEPGRQYLVKHANSTCRASVTAINYIVDVNTMEKAEPEAAGRLRLNNIAGIALTAAKPLFFDSYATSRTCGSFILIDPVTNNTSAVGMITGPDNSACTATYTDTAGSGAVPLIDTAALGIQPDCYGVVDKIVECLARQGVEVRVEHGGGREVHNNTKKQA